MSIRRSEVAQRDEKETTRVEAFSDGVFAIAITLLILDVKIQPLADPTERQLLLALGHEWKRYIAYLMSFSVILVMWVSHHRIFKLIHRVDQPFLYWNGLLLLLVSIVPFPTSLLAEYFQTPAARTAAAVYSGHGLLISLAFTSLWRHATRTDRLLVPGSRPTATLLGKRYRFGPFMYLVAFALSFLSAYLSMGLCLLFACFFAVQGFRSQARD